MLTSIHAAIGIDTVFVEDGPEILEPEQSEEDHGDVLEGKDVMSERLRLQSDQRKMQ
jgi:hypothetical protein